MGLFGNRSKDQGKGKVIDPVCGMEVNPKTAAAKYEYSGKTYYFCAPGCKRAFEKNPTQYLDEAGNPKPGHGMPKM